MLIQEAETGSNGAKTELFHAMGNSGGENAFGYISRRIANSTDEEELIVLAQSAKKKKKR